MTSRRDCAIVLFVESPGSFGRGDGIMYYVLIVLLLVTCVLAARFCVGLFARIERRGTRRWTFWALMLPACFVVSFVLLIPIADDMVFFRSPSVFMLVAAPLLVVNLALVGFAVMTCRNWCRNSCQPFRYL